MGRRHRSPTVVRFVGRHRDDVVEVGFVDRGRDFDRGGQWAGCVHGPANRVGGRSRNGSSLGCSALRRDDARIDGEVERRGRERVGRAQCIPERSLRTENACRAERRGHRSSRARCRTACEGLRIRGRRSGAYRRRWRRRIPGAPRVGGRIVWCHHLEISHGGGAGCRDVERGAGRTLSCGRSCGARVAPNRPGCNPRSCGAVLPA